MHLQVVNSFMYHMFLTAVVIFSYQPVINEIYFNICISFLDVLKLKHLLKVDEARLL